MNPPEMPAQAAQEWAKLQYLVSEDIERQIDEHIADEHERRRMKQRTLERAING